MKRILLIFFCCVFFNDVPAQKTAGEGAKLLFKNIKTALNIEEQNKIFKLTGFGMSNDKKQFTIDNDPTSLEYPFDVAVYPADINNDGKEELFIVFGNSYTSGMAGTNVLLFIKNKAGIYGSNFGFSGAAPLIMPTKNLGYPDLLIGGPGFEFPVWRWNGKEYVFYKKIADKDLGKLKVTPVEEASKTYVSKMKK